MSEPAQENAAAVDVPQGKSVAAKLSEELDSKGVKNGGNEETEKKDTGRLGEIDACIDRDSRDGEEFDPWFKDCG